jgi:cyclic beta-1,2-glucan synthetase
VGRGGWTWYTGAAGWFRRIALENLLGLRLKGGVLYIEPALPSSWDGYEADWTDNKNLYHISVRKDGTVFVTVNGMPIDNEAKVVISRNNADRLES